MKMQVARSDSWVELLSMGHNLVYSPHPEKSMIIKKFIDIACASCAGAWIAMIVVVCVQLLGKLSVALPCIPPP